MHCSFAGQVCKTMEETVNEVGSCSVLHALQGTIYFCQQRIKIRDTETRTLRASDGQELGNKAHTWSGGGSAAYSPRRVLCCTRVFLLIATTTNHKSKYLPVFRILPVFHATAGFHNFELGSNPPNAPCRDFVQVDHWCVT